VVWKETAVWLIDFKGRVIWKARLRATPCQAVAHPYPEVAALGTRSFSTAQRSA
jgi:hypothetical protein